MCSRDSTHKRPALSAKFQFDDYIRCVSARQLLIRSKDNLRVAKMTRIAKMLHLPLPEPSPTLSAATASAATLVPPPSHGAALRQQTDTLHHNMGVISISPTPQGVLLGDPSPTAAQTDLTNSVLTKAFLQPAATPLNPQEFEMSNFRLHHLSGSHLHSLAEADAPVVFDSPVKLAPPIENYSSEESGGHSFRESLDSSLTNVHIGSDSLLVRYDNLSKSRTPDTLLEQSLESHNAEEEGEWEEREWEERELTHSSDLSSSSEQAATPAEGYKVEQLGGGEMGVASLFDPAAAEEDEKVDARPRPTIQQPFEAEITTMNVWRERMPSNDSPRSQLLISVEQGTDPLADEEDDPWSLAGNGSGRQGLRNGNIMSSGNRWPTSATGYVEGGAPGNQHQPTAHTTGAVHGQLPASSNIIWDIPLIEEIKYSKREDGSSSDRTGPADSAVTHANHARIT